MIARKDPPAWMPGNQTMQKMAPPVHGVFQAIRGCEGSCDEKLKTKTIEYLDSRVVKYIVEETAKMKEDVTIAVIPDHATPCVLRTHTHDPVPFVIYRPGNKPDEVDSYDEESAKNGHFGLLKGNEFFRALLNK